MLFGNIHAPNTFEKLVSHDPILRSLQWIRKMPPGREPGIYEIQGEEIFVNVHGYDTLPRTECRFESHRQYVDVQYCIEGGEFIDWQLASRLEPDGEFDAAHDLQFYRHQEGMTSLHMTPGDFSIFFPEDAHRPKVRDGVNRSVRKLVVKVSCDLLR